MDATNRSGRPFTIRSENSAFMLRSSSVSAVALAERLARSWILRKEVAIFVRDFFNTTLLYAKSAGNYHPYRYFLRLFFDRLGGHFGQLRGSGKERRAISNRRLLFLHRITRRLIGSTCSPNGKLPIRSRSHRSRIERRRHIRPLWLI